MSSQVNYTLTYFAEHAQRWSHDTINRYLRGEKITPRLVWENVRDAVVPSANGYVLFDDTVVNKAFSFHIELVRRQWSGNEHRVIKGMGVVTCVYVNPELDRFWIMDYRLYAPDEDGKTKLDHVQEMLRNVHYQKQLPFRTVLMDSWYATRRLMRYIERLDKIYYCPLKSNRNVDESNGDTAAYQRLDSLTWSATERQHGKCIHVKGFPKGHRVKLFRLVLSTQRTDYVVTNDLTQDSTEATQEECALRWKIAQFHRETKQVTGIEACQCRKGRIQRNHIGCAMLVWVRLKAYAEETAQTIYQVKEGMLSGYMIEQLKNPKVRMVLA